MGFGHLGNYHHSLAVDLSILQGHRSQFASCCEPPPGSSGLSAQELEVVCLEGAVLYVGCFYCAYEFRMQNLECPYECHGSLCTSYPLSDSFSSGEDPGD